MKLKATVVVVPYTMGQWDTSTVTQEQNEYQQR